MADIALAGQADGTSIKSLGFGNQSDRAILDGPVEAGLGLVAGQAVQFTGVGGSVNVPGYGSNIGPNGSSFYPTIDTGEAFGLSSVRGPIGALVGVYVDDKIPSQMEITPERLDFSSSLRRDEAILNPLLRQVFYIGAGINTAGKVKSFVVPIGATRLFLGVLDAAGENSDNWGSFQVMVMLPNSTPALGPIQNRTIDELSPLTFTVTATDTEVPGQTLTYSLDAGAELGASINSATGLFSWTPTEAQGPGTYPITLRVTDNGTPNLSTNQKFTITVNEVNVPPNISNPGDQIMNENSTVSLRIAASDPDLPPQKLSFSLEPVVPIGAILDANTGEFQWTPTEAQGPSTNQITIRVTDGASASSAAFQVVIKEVNLPPVLALISDQKISAGQQLAVQVSASDPDLPAQILTFTLDPGAPTGAIIDPATGLITWIPSPSQAGSTNRITVRVTDNGQPQLSDTDAFNVIVPGGPANDDFANRTIISGSYVSVTGSNVKATPELGEPGHASSVPQKSVWWSWTAPSSGPVPISTAGSAFDTLLAVYTGSALNTLTRIAANDDDAAAGGTTSRVEFSAVAGVEYQIAVDGFGEEGDIKLTIGASARPKLRIQMSGKNVILSWPANEIGFILDLNST